MLRERPSLTLAGRRVGADAPPYVVAEIGLNHGGSIDRALALVDAAAEAHADAIKLQSLVAHELVSPSCPAPAHVAASSLADFFQTFELDEDAHARIVARARELRLPVLSTALSLGAVDMLERVGVDGYKIASGDLTWDALIDRCARTGKPLVLSTGMATMDEVWRAIAVARGAGARDLAVLHCVSAYPVPAGSENLAVIGQLGVRLGLPVGLSDHGADTAAWPVAVALGACLYERHLVLPHDHDAVDRDVSSTPGELAAAVAAGRRAWRALGSGEKRCVDAEAPNRIASRRSLHAGRDLPRGAVLGLDDVLVVRPEIGLPPSRLASIVGLPLAEPVAAGQPLLDRHFPALAAGSLDTGSPRPAHNMEARDPAPAHQ